MGIYIPKKFVTDVILSILVNSCEKIVQLYNELKFIIFLNIQYVIYTNLIDLFSFHTCMEVI